MKGKSENKRVKIVGKTIMGDTRSYEFDLLPARIGVELQNEYRFLLMANATSIAEIVSWVIENIVNGINFGKKEDGLFVRIVKIFKVIAVATPMVELVPKIITKERMNNLAEQLLAGGSVDGEVLDEEGMCSLFGRNVSELDSALFHSILANFPYLQGWLDPLLDALKKKEGEDSPEEDEDMNPASGQQQMMM